MNVINVPNWLLMRELKGSLNWYNSKGKDPAYLPAKEKEEKIYREEIDSCLAASRF